MIYTKFLTFPNKTVLTPIAPGNIPPKAKMSDDEITIKLINSTLHVTVGVETFEIQFQDEYDEDYRDKLLEKSWDISEKEGRETIESHLYRILALQNGNIEAGEALQEDFPNLDFNKILGLTPLSEAVSEIKRLLKGFAKYKND